MKHKIWLLTLIFMTQPFVVSAGTSIDQELISLVKKIERAINENDQQFLSTLLSSRARSEVKDFFLKSRSVRFIQDVKSVSAGANNQYKVTGNFAAYGVSWRTVGLSNYYVFAKENGNWVLVDTNLPERMGVKAALQIVGLVFSVLGLLGLVILVGLYLAGKFKGTP